MGTAAYRLDRLRDAEDALMEACLLDNRCPDTWLALALVCLACSLTADATRPAKQRRDEAEQAAQQGLRLLATNAPLLRELAAAFVAADRVQAAEEVVRRAGAVESAHDGGNGRPHPHTRKLLADILAVQNHALAAVDEYREVLGDAAALLSLSSLSLTHATTHSCRCWATRRRTGRRSGRRRTSARYCCGAWAARRSCTGCGGWWTRWVWGSR